MKGSLSEDPKNIFQKSVRESDSSFSLYTEEETKKALNILEDMINLYGEEYLKDLIQTEKKMYGLSIQMCAIKK